jgi:uncharacterized protein
MKVTGDATVGAPAESVKAALRDPDILAKVIPGCEDFQIVSAGKCWLTVATQLPGVEGTYTGEATVHERQPPGVLAADVSVAGVQSQRHLGGDRRTQLNYDVDAEFGGALAGVGKRMLASIATRLAGEFIGALDGELAPRAMAQEPAAEPVPAPAEPIERVELAEPDQAAEPAQPRGRGIAGGRARRPGRAASEARLDVPAQAEPVDQESMDEAPNGHRLPGLPGAKTGLIVGGAAALAGVVVSLVLARRRRASQRSGR